MAQLTPRDFLKTTGAAAAVIVLTPLRGPASTSPPPGTWNHDPASPIGPNHWGDIGFPTCGQGMSQSPVNIRTDRVAAYHGASLLLRYESSGLAVENTGHVIEVPNAAVTRFHKVIARFPFYDGYPNNNRPVQPLNGRVIRLRRGGGEDRG